MQDLPGILAGEMTSCPSELSAWIGPSISQANYEIGPDVWKILEQIAPETLKELLIQIRSVWLIYPS